MEVVPVRPFGIVERVMPWTPGAVMASPETR
jgi:hypothetical protein